VIETALSAREETSTITPASPPKSRIAVIHLVRQPNKIALLQAFADTYRRHAAGIAHDLVILFKGFPEERIPPQCREVLHGIDYSQLFLPDVGHDIATYFAAARACCGHDYLFFVNSFSEILDAEWLAKFHAHAASERVGAVSATASLESPVNNLRLNRHDDIWSGKREWLGRVLDPLRIGRRLRYVKGIWAETRRYPLFPNPHLRTNGFMIRRERFLGLKVGRLLTKRESHMFECGWLGMSRQLYAMNLECIVVGRDGRGFTKDTWYESSTFRSGEQRNLLIADNRTKHFELLDSQGQRRSTYTSWGVLADRGERSEATQGNCGLAATGAQEG
jgi:hypothetical protein